MDDGMTDLIKRIERLEKAVFPVHRDDDLLQEAIKIVRLHKVVTTSLLQRKLSIGYARASRLLDELENGGIVGSQIGINPRKLIVK
jgi:S-DNA-T family DNA segregation ATPase FtsK/SpoIIIE